LNWNDEVRAATLNSGTRASTLRISSLMPSEKYSLSASPDMFTNGRTAIDFSATAGRTTGVTPCGSPDAVAGAGPVWS
jgi:hypothetical protein